MEQNVFVCVCVMIARIGAECGILNGKNCKFIRWQQLECFAVGAGGAICVWRAVFERMRKFGAKTKKEQKENRRAHTDNNTHRKRCW